MHPHEDRTPPWVQSRQVSPLRLLLVDDHLMVTEALASRLSSAPDLWVAGRCTTAEASLLDIVRGVRPDVITVEVEGLGAGVGEFLERMIAARPEARVVVLTADHEVAHAVAAARVGVSAWVAKEQGAAELEAVVRGVAKGESWFPPAMLGPILAELRADVEPGPAAGRLAGRAQPPGEGRAAGHDGRQAGPPDRARPEHLDRHRADPHPQHLRQAGRTQPPGGGPGGALGRPASRPGCVMNGFGMPGAPGACRAPAAGGGDHHQAGGRGRGAGAARRHRPAGRLRHHRRHRQRGPAARAGSGGGPGRAGGAVSAHTHRPPGRPDRVAAARLAAGAQGVRRRPHPHGQGRGARPDRRAPGRCGQDRPHLPRVPLPRVPAGGPP